MKLYSILCQFLLLTGVLAFLSSNALADSCEIDLENNTHTCQNISAIKFIDGPSGNKVVMRISFETSTTNYTEASFTVEYKKKAVGWTVNIGDSISNNGFAGDDGHQSNDAEMQILDQVLSVYGSDYSAANARQLLKSTPLVEGKRASIKLTIKNQSLSWVYNGQTSDLSSQYLYALQGQRDDEGSINFDIYAAFNRTIVPSDRNGTGVRKVIVELK